MFLGDLRDLFFPPVCPACGRAFDGAAGILCTRCQWDLPLTGFETEADNPVARRFWGLVPIENATAMMWFIHLSGSRRVVHRFKYHDRPELARGLGRRFGRMLADTDLYAGVDVIVPVPLHFRKFLQRGYNQSEETARGMAREMEVPVDFSAVVRRVNNRSQTATERTSERWENVEGIFKVRRPGRLAGKHVLLVDDVLTTGATIGSCAEAIFRSVPDCRVSIAALYASKKGLGIKD